MNLGKIFDSISSSCDIRGCETEDGIELVTVKPFDPIDHDEKMLTLCPKHQEWAAEHNEFAKRMIEKMRDYRAELGSEHAEEAKRLATPEDSEMDEPADIELDEL